ncbi:DNA topoisomerase (ATP-hydrolyzing) subunit B [uncultured Traorella sp.]|uniref:DNA topoisomerase (ATP-hydrolyzing) subunit B n=1 Tax=uncultured Traorella sp. TaxID=1929048 RepID=UPI0025EEFA31|nr:DNA topoisomerase (ATP-hydrolyzing) subunit B [uncultured Traorella sp.]
MEEKHELYDLEAKVEHSYEADDIQVLEGLEAVRKRPGMYIGSTSQKGLHHLVWEIVDNSIDEALAGYATDIHIRVTKDHVVEVEDNGRGMPVGINSKSGISAVETIFTILHAGGKFGGGAYKVSGGLHGVGASVVNALSSWLTVSVFNEGKEYFVKFVNGGNVETPLHVIGECDPEKHGSLVTFKADPEIFQETCEYDFDTLNQRIRQLAFLNKGIHMHFEFDPEDKKVDYLYVGGIKEYVAYLNKNKEPLHEDIVYCEGEDENVLCEVAMQYNDGYIPNIYSFCNNINTVEGGTHEEGFRLALTRVINNYAREINMLKKDESLSSDDVREGLTAIISVKHPDPQYEGQTKTKLGNSEVRKIVSNIFGKQLERFFLENPSTARTIVDKAILASKARLAAKKARELTRRKGDLDITNFYGKLSDCKSKDASECEIFLVEGDSAGGSAIKGRNSMTQAILPLRGKILNVEKARLDRALSNEEIRTIITAFGTGIGEEFDLSKLRYDKIIIMTDADVDGSHIRVLLLTLFYRFFKPIVEAGHVYAAQPPLFVIKHGKKIKYVLNEAERDEYLATLSPNTKYEINRMKGLGEMDAEELNETTMDINKRILRQITVDDAIMADEIFTTLMGEEVEPRRQFIENNATYVTNLDI